MNKSLKATLATASIAAMAGAFSPAVNAANACASCSAWVEFGDAQANHVSVTDGVAAFNSGNPDTNQASAIYGAGFTVNSVGGLSVSFDADLSTWDSYNQLTGTGTGYYDAFVVTVSKSGYYWNLPHMDPIAENDSTFVWGGTNWADGIEEHYVTALTGGDTVSLLGSGTFYVSFVLDTKTLPDADIIHPSTGTFHVAAVTPIPEPETYAMLLAGLGLMGFVARRRQRKLAIA